MISMFSLRSAIVAAASLSVLAASAPPVLAQADPLMGQMMLFGGNFCPRGWADANGQTITIASNSALFSLLGTTYGGNGTSTFALPDLRGRTAINLGQGPGLPRYAQGEVGGSAATTLTVQNLPVHTHGVTATLNASGQDGTSATPTGNSLAASTGGTSIYRTRGAPDQALAAASVTVSVANAGGNQSFDTRSPYLTMRWCIATDGIFPPRP